jgi:hypothetical protein
MIDERLSEEYQRFVKRAPCRPGLLVAQNAVRFNQHDDTFFHRRYDGSNTVDRIPSAEWVNKKPRCQRCGCRITDSEPCLLISLDCATCFACYYDDRLATLVYCLLLMAALVEKHLVVDLGATLTRCLADVLIDMQRPRWQTDSVVGGTKSGHEGTVYPLARLVEFQLHRFFRTGFVVFQAIVYLDDDGAEWRPSTYRVMVVDGAAALYVTTLNWNDHSLQWRRPRGRRSALVHMNARCVFDELMALLCATAHAGPYTILPYVSRTVIERDVRTRRLDQWIELRAANCMDVDK